MAWIRTPAPGAESPELTALFDRIRARSSRGAVSHLWQALALDPAGLETTWTAYRRLTDDPAPLTAAQLEMIVIAVSATNGCGYCVAHHGPRLAALTSDELARAVARDYREANLAARDRVLLDLAVALTCECSERTAADLERPREYGFDDAVILKAVQVAAFYAWINRLVLGLGVELEPDREAWEFGAQR